MVRLPEGTAVATIAAVAAIAGAIVGGAVTYLGNEQLQNHQIEQEQTRQETAARAVVRLLMSEYHADGDQLVDMLGSHAYSAYSYRERTFVSHIGEEDHKLLAGNLSEQDWIKVSTASRAIEAVEADLEAHRGKGRLGIEEFEIFEQARSVCNTAYAALMPLAEGKSTF
jgi:hypothetical protein